VVEQVAVDFCGVFGGDPVGVGVGQVVLVVALVVVAPVQFGQLGGGGLLGGSTATVKDCASKIFGALAGGVAAGAQIHDIDVDTGQWCGAVSGKVVEIQIAEGVFGQSIGVVVGVGRRLVLEVDVGGVKPVGHQIGVAGGPAARGVGGVGNVGVDRRGVMGEQFDPIGEQPGVFVGA
jgi:hypothetical protein